MASGLTMATIFWSSFQELKPATILLVGDVVMQTASVSRAWLLLHSCYWPFSLVKFLDCVGVGP